jgi:glucoamylase
MRARYLLILLVLLAFPATAAAQTAPGRPGANATWTEADKDGYGTSTTTDSKIWHTLDDGRLTEVYYPDLGTPALRDLQLIVTDGRTFTDRETDDTTPPTARS